MGGKVLPQVLPRGKPAAVRVGINGRIKQGPPLALREAAFDMDRDVKLDVRGLPVCQNRELHPAIGRANALRRAEKRCGGSIVGRGRVGISFTFPNQAPIPESSRVVVFNGGLRDGTIVFYALTETKVPVPSLLNARIEVRRKGSGWIAVAKTPVIAGGSGAITRFALNLGRKFTYSGKRRSLLSARCSDGKFKFSVPKLLFRNEANIPSAAPRTILQGNLIVPCKPKR